jgi:hypothetical protein
MSQKILLAGVAGGVVMFIWGAVAHMALGVGESSMKAMQNEDAVLAVMKENMREPGLYLFPGGAMSGDMTKEQQEAMMKKWERGPSGFLVFHPEGMPAMSAKTLLTELFSNILASLVAAFLLSQALSKLTNFGSRVLFVTLLGLVPFFSISVSFWNWYGFPGGFTFGELIEQVVGFALAGLVFAAILKQPAA